MKHHEITTIGRQQNKNNNQTDTACHTVWQNYKNKRTTKTKQKIRTEKSPLFWLYENENI